MVCLQRKTTNDLIACLTTNRERFCKELERAARIPNFCLVCDGSYYDILNGNNRSNMNPRAAFQSVVAMMGRYRIPFLMAGSEKVAAVLAESILLKWLREHVKVIESIDRAIRDFNVSPLAGTSDRRPYERPKAART